MCVLWQGVATIFKGISQQTGKDYNIDDSDFVDGKSTRIVCPCSGSLGLPKYVSEAVFEEPGGNALIVS